MGVTLRCFIERSRSLATALSPVYTLYCDFESKLDCGRLLRCANVGLSASRSMSADGSGRMLMAARKMVKSQTPYYVISTNQDDLFKVQ
jgi:hypothetical protein